MHDLEECVLSRPTRPLKKWKKKECYVLDNSIARKIVQKFKICGISYKKHLCKIFENINSFVCLQLQGANYNLESGIEH